MRKILVIKLSALGDFILSIAPMQAIRAHHPDAHLTLLTTAPFVELAAALKCFDEIWTDERPPIWQAPAWLKLARKLRSSAFDRIYDLQRSTRTAWYYRISGRPEWVGKVPGCTHYFEPDWGTERHIVEWEREQLLRVGVEPQESPDLSVLEGDLERFNLPTDYALLIPGSAPHRPGKRWPAARYGELARALDANGMVPILIGGAAERAELAEIAMACPPAHNLCGETNLFDIATLARGARIAIGNDTGPTHLIAATGCPLVALFSDDSDPVRSRPPWPNVEVLRQPRLADLDVARVMVLARRITRPAA